MREDEDKKACAKCGKIYPLALFGRRGLKNPVPKSYCPNCRRDAMRKSRQRNPDTERHQYKLHRTEIIARKRLARARREGWFPNAVEFTCAMVGCNHQAQEYHHLNYAEVSEVAPMCIDCHKALDAGGLDVRSIQFRLVFDQRDRRKQATKLRKFHG